MADGDPSAQIVDPARSNLQTDVGNRNVTIEPADRAEAKRIIAEMPADKRPPLLTVEREVAQNKYDSTINAAVTATRLRAPDAAIDPLVVKSLLYQESNFKADPGNRGNYQGIAQIGGSEARSHGLTVGGGVDERLDPSKAIGAVPKILSEYDYAIPYSKYVKEGLGTTPQGDDRARFYLAAYNGGSGTVSAAMRIAAAEGRNPLDFQNLLAKPGEPIESSPLYKAIDTVLRKEAPSIDSHEKYSEISHYANDIVARAEAMRSSVVQTQTQTQAVPVPEASPHPGAPEAPPIPKPVELHPVGSHPVDRKPATSEAGRPFDRAAVAREVGTVALAPKSHDLTNEHLTQRSLVDAVGNLEAHAGVPITVSVINTGHGTSAVDNEHKHGHKAGYAADLYVDRRHDSPEARTKLLEALAKDPYVTKVGLGGDYNTHENRRILEAGGKYVFADNDQSHVHVQSEIDPKKLKREEMQDTTARPHAPVPPIHISRDDAAQTAIRAGTRQFGTILEASGDKIVQNVGGGHTATYSRAELLAHTPAADHAAINTALAPGNTVEFRFGRGSMTLSQVDPQTNALQPVRHGAPEAAPPLPTPVEIGR